MPISFKTAFAAGAAAAAAQQEGKSEHEQLQKAELTARLVEAVDARPTLVSTPEKDTAKPVAPAPSPRRPPDHRRDQGEGPLAALGRWLRRARDP